MKNYFFFVIINLITLTSETNFGMSAEEINKKAAKYYSDDERARAHGARIPCPYNQLMTTSIIALNNQNELAENLHQAAFEGNVAGVKNALSSLRKVDIRSGGMTALHRACNLGFCFNPKIGKFIYAGCDNADYFTVIRLLIAHGLKQTDVITNTNETAVDSLNSIFEFLEQRRNDIHIDDDTVINTFNAIALIKNYFEVIFEETHEADRQY